jgi:hypothetical protein
MKLSALLAVLYSMVCVNASAEVAPPAPSSSSGMTPQLQSVFSYWGAAFGPQSLGVAP